MAKPVDSTFRQDFKLPEEESLLLEKNFKHWATITDEGSNLIVIHDYTLPSGYNLKTTNLAVIWPPGYPAAGLDMVYFSPALSRKDNKKIVSITERTVEGTAWQQWSRHYEWRVGADDLSTHLIRIKQWLIDELKR